MTVNKNHVIGIVLLVLVLSASAAPQSKKRQEQIEGLIKRSDLVALAVAQSYYPVIDIGKYRLEREQREAPDPRRRSKYTIGTAYKLSVKEIIFQKPQKDSREHGRAFYPDDAIMIYTRGPAAHPLDLDNVTFLPGTEYLVFLKRISLDPDDFPRGVRQDLNATMREWELFPNPEETYLDAVRDSFAVKPIDEVWRKFAYQTLAIARAMAAQQTR